MAPKLALADALLEEHNILAWLRSQPALLLRVGELYHPLAIAYVQRMECGRWNPASA